MTPAEWRRMYEGGLTVDEIGVLVGRPYSAVYRVLRKAGTKFRARGRRPVHNTPSA